MKSLSLSLPDQDYDFYRYALDQLAAEVITDEEAGQRGNKRSSFVMMIAAAGIANFGETVRLLKEIKGLINASRLCCNATRIKKTSFRAR